MCGLPAFLSPTQRLAGLLVAWLVAVAPTAQANKLTLERPGDREFVRDTARLLSPGEAGQVRQRCDQLLTDAEVPLFVLTVASMAEHGGEGMTVESFAQTLFDQWGDTHPLVMGQKWETGILLVVSVGDRQARIELGRSWAGTKDASCRQIMDEHLLPAFRAGDYAGGITAGVDALDAMARGQPLPRRPVPARTYIFWVGFAGLAIFTAVSLIRRGGDGWAWAFWAAVLVFVGGVLYFLVRSSGAADAGGERPGGGSFTGGGSSSGGGGFSGGGGASGSW